MSASRALSPSAQSFLSHLALPHEHNDISSFHHAELSYVGEGVFELPRSTFVTHAPPKIGPISSLELHDDSYIEWIRTAWTMTAPTLAMMELWLRFFALIVGPVCVGCLFAWELCGRRNAFVSNLRMTVAILAVASSAVVFTDSLYVYEYGREVGCYLFLVSSALTLRLVHRLRRVAKPSHAHDDKRNKDRRTQCKSNIFSILAWGLIAITAIVFMRSDGGHALKLHIETVPYLSSILSGHNLQVSDPGIDLPTIEPGFYHSSNPFIQSIAKHWPETSRSYNVSNGATPYLVNGDQRTGIPFLVNKVEEQEYVRVYVTNPYDYESIALDIAFPYSNGDSDEYHSLQESPFVYHLDKPVYLILHGLNGGSHEEYVKDFVRRRRAEGSTVVVMIARGMMDTSMKGWNVFHGARTGDIDIAARAMRRGLDQISKAHGIQRQMLAGVGYSMGAIILSNYVARSGIHCALDSAVAVSGGLDMRQQLNFKRSMRLWQPMLTFGLRDDILLGKYARHYKHRLTKAQFMSMLRVSSISHLDVEAIVNYNRYDNLIHYYSEMSAMGDRNPEFNLLDQRNVSTCETTHSKSWGRIENVSIPFLVLQALDDPLVGWRTIGTEDVQGLAESGRGNTILLLTKAGGHVGWPLGGNPKKHSWEWMNNVGRDFVLAIMAAAKEGHSNGLVNK